MSLDSLPDRIVDKIHFEPNTGCWLWTGKIDRHGYGHTSASNPRRSWLAHRYVYTLLVGPIDAALCTDHLCRVRACCNPAHLRIVTRLVNTMENSQAIPALNAYATNCIHGHPFNERNTYRYRGARLCRPCNSRRVADYNQRRQSEVMP